MAHRIEAKAWKHRPFALTGAVLVLTLFAGIGVSGAHSHSGAAELPVSCAICVSTHQASISSSHSPPPLTTATLTAPPVLAPRILSRRAPTLSYRTRAPPFA